MISYSVLTAHFSQHILPQRWWQPVEKFTVGPGQGFAGFFLLVNLGKSLIWTNLRRQLSFVEPRLGPMAAKMAVKVENVVVNLVIEQVVAARDTGLGYTVVLDNVVVSLAALAAPGHVQVLVVRHDGVHLGLDRLGRPYERLVFLALWLNLPSSFTFTQAAGTKDSATVLVAGVQDFPGSGGSWTIQFGS